MKHHYQVFISYILALSMSIVFLLNQFPLIAHAEISDNQKAVFHSAYNSFGWQYDFYDKAWTIEDPTGIPQASKLTPLYFYTSDNVTFFAVDGYKLFSLICTGGIGLVLKPNELNAIIQQFFAQIGDPTVVEGGVYDGNRNFLGYALNDITGCYYEGIAETDNPDITIPKEHLNNFYNFYNYQKNVNPTYPDYITVYPPSSSFILSNYQDLSYINNSNYPDPKSSLSSRLISYINSNDNLGRLYFGYTGNTTNAHCSITFMGNYKAQPNIYTAYCVPLNDFYYIYDQNTYWDNFCDFFDLTNDKKTITYNDLWNINRKPANNCYISFYAYDENNQIYSGNYERPYLIADASDTPTTIGGWSLGFSGSSNGQSYISLFAGKPYTIYKSLSIYNSINVDKDYEQKVFYSKTFNDYSVNNSKNITIKKTVIDNSINTSTTIYNDVVEDFYDNSDNSTVNTEQIDNSTTTIINNYYPELAPEDPDNPSNPDNPSDPDDTLNPDNPSGILDAILDALARFFRAIGRILATILAGLLEVVDSVLEAIAGIMENMTGVTEFISALFSWMPQPVPQVLAAALSVAILFALIRFIRG